MAQAVENLGIGLLHSFQWGVNRNTLQQMEASNAAQRYLMEKTRLGIPAILTGEGVHGHLSTGATIFPQRSPWRVVRHGIGRTDRVRSCQRSKIGRVAQILSLVLDLARDPDGAGCRRPTARTRI